MDLHNLHVVGTMVFQATPKDVRELLLEPSGVLGRLHTARHIPPHLHLCLATKQNCAQGSSFKTCLGILHVVP